MVAFGQLYLILLFFAVIFAINLGYTTVDRLLRSMAIGASLSSLAATLEFVVALAGPKVRIFDVAGIPWPRPAGLMTEPDWAALVAGMGFFLAYFQLERGTFRRVALAVNGLAIVVTAARATWVSLILCALVMLFSKEKIRYFAKRAVPVLILIIVGVTAVVIAKPNELTRLSPNAVLSGTGSGDEGSTHSRLGVIHLVESKVPSEPLYGFGAGSLAGAVDLPANQLAFGGGGQLNAGHGNANLELTSLWDGGWILLAVVVLLLISWLKCAWRVFGTMAGAISCFIASYIRFSDKQRFSFRLRLGRDGVVRCGLTPGGSVTATTADLEEFSVVSD